MRTYFPVFLFLFLLVSCSSNDDQEQEIIDEPQCSIPTNISINNITQNSAGIIWSSVSGASNYEIEYGLEGFDQGTGQIMSTSISSLALNNLETNTNYSFYLRANCGENNISDWVGPTNFNTLDTCLEPIHNQSITVSNSQFEIFWDADSSIDTFQIEYGLIGFTQGTGDIVQVTNSNSYVIENLLNSTNYQYYLRSQCSQENFSSWVGPYNHTTPTETCNLTPTITNVFPDFSFPHEALIYWDYNLYSHNTYIQVEYGLPGFELGTGTVKEGVYTNLGIIMEPLELNTTYEVYVRAKCAEGYFSPYSEPVQFTTEQ